MTESAKPAIVTATQEGRPERVLILDDACGCSQTTVCAAHEKPNQSAFPGEELERLIDLVTLKTATSDHLDALAAKQYGLLRQPSHLIEAGEAPPLEYQPPTLGKIEQTRTIVSTNGRDWVNYALLGDSAEPLNSYPHWQIWRGDELLIFRPAKPADPPACQATSETNESGVCEAPALQRPNRSKVPLCDRCYLDNEFDIASLTRRRPAHVMAWMRLAAMEYNAAGLGATEPRACSPKLFGGIWNIGR